WHHGDAQGHERCRPGQAYFHHHGVSGQELAIEGSRACACRLKSRFRPHRGRKRFRHQVPLRAGPGLQRGPPMTMVASSVSLSALRSTKVGPGLTHFSVCALPRGPLALNSASAALFDPLAITCTRVTPGWLLAFHSMAVTAVSQLGSEA